MPLACTQPPGKHWPAVDGELAPTQSQKRMWILILGLQCRQRGGRESNKLSGKSNLK